MVGQDAIDFLGHVAVERAKSCFYMIDREMLFGSREGSREGGVGVAIDYDSVVSV